MGASALKRRRPAVALAAIRIKADAAESFSVAPALTRVIAAIGNNTTAAILGVAPSEPSRWRRGLQSMNPEQRRKVAELDYLLARIFQVFHPKQASAWLMGAEPFLGGARPLDVFMLRGAEPVINALRQFEAGSFA